MLPKHKYLLSYRYAEIIHDLTVDFCHRFILSNLSSLSTLSNFPDRRTADQMVQAARSGKQNVVEGVGQSATSKKGEIKLLGVAKASLEELTSDYEDFLRQRKLPIHGKDSPQVQACRQLGYRLSSLSNVSTLGYLKEKPTLPVSPADAANFLLTLCHITSYLLSRQIMAMEKKFVKEGGFTEKLFQKRLFQKSHK